MKKWFLKIMAVILLSGCSTYQIQVDYDPEFKFSSLSKFAVLYNKKSDARDFDRSRIAKIVGSHLQEKGYASTDKASADFYVVVHLDVQTKSQVETNYETIGIRPYVPCFELGLDRVACRELRYSQSLALPEPQTRVTTRTYEYEEGRLIVELVDVKQNEIVWQGIARDEIGRESSQEQKSEYIKKIVEELFKDFPSR